MFQKILVALDRSPSSLDVFQKTLELAKACSAQLMLLHALSAEEENSPLPIPTGAEQIYWAPGSELNLELWQQQWKNYQTECLQTLQTYAAKANQQGVVTEFRQISDSAGRAICRMAQSWAADLIVVGNRGRFGLKEAFLGSVSNYVLHHAPCSVLTIKLAESEPKGISR
jgi:nucleotide-binding universal stress UspA family protein